jgi:hypothetical protein
MRSRHGLRGLVTLRPPVTLRILHVTQGTKALIVSQLLQTRRPAPVSTG